MYKPVTFCVVKHARAHHLHSPRRTALLLILPVFVVNLPGTSSNLSRNTTASQNMTTDTMSVLGHQISRVLIPRKSKDDEPLAGPLIMNDKASNHNSMGFFGLPREIRDRIYDWLIVLDDPIIRPISGPWKMNGRLLRSFRCKFLSDQPTYRKQQAHKLYTKIAGGEIPQYLLAYKHASSKEPMYVKYTNAVCAHALVLNRQFCREVLERVEWWALPALRVLKVAELRAIPAALKQSEPRRMGVTFAFGSPLIPIARNDVEKTLLACMEYIKTLVKQLPRLDHLAAAIFIKHDGNQREALDLFGPTSALSAALPGKQAQLEHFWLGIDCNVVFEGGKKSRCTMRTSWDGIMLSQQRREGDLQTTIMQRTGEAKARVVFRVEERLVEGIVRKMGSMFTAKRR